MKRETRRIIPGIGEAVVRFKIYSENGAMVCVVDQLDGCVDLPPKKWLSLMRGELRLLEGAAREVGCTEMRFVGRFTKRMFPDYEPYTAIDGGAGLRKAL